MTAEAGCGRESDTLPAAGPLGELRLSRGVTWSPLPRLALSSPPSVRQHSACRPWGTGSSGFPH